MTLSLTSLFKDAHYPSKRFLPLFLVSILVGGLAAIPPNALFMCAGFCQAPFSDAFLRTYHAESPLFYIIGGLVGVRSTFSYLLYCGGMLSALYVLLYGLARKNSFGVEAGFIVLLFVNHPIGYVLQSWIGMVDVLSVACATVLVFSRPQRVLFFFISLFYVVSHTSALFVVPVLLALRWMAEEDVEHQHFASGIVGIVIGRIVVVSLLYSMGINNVSRLDEALNTPLAHWITINVKYLPLALYTFNFLFWLPTFLMVRWYFHTHPRFYGLYICSLGLFFTVTWITRDTTRVFAILSWAPTLYCILHTWKTTQEQVDEERAKLFRHAVILCATLGWLSPRLFVWDGRIYSPWFSQILQYYNLIQ